MATIEDLKYDTRLVRRNIKDGRLDQEDYDRHLKSLPDAQSNAESLKSPEGPASPEGESDGGGHGE